MSIYVVSYTTPYGSRSTMLLDDMDTVERTLRALDAAGCTDADFDERTICSPSEAKNRILQMILTQCVESRDILKAWEGDKP